MKRSRFVLAAAALTAAAASIAKPVAYYGGGVTYLIDWKGTQQARVVSGAGARSGQVVDNGSYRLVTLDEPFSYLNWSGNDSCGDFEERLLTEQVLVRDLPHGQAQIIEMGEDKFFGGCQDGQSTPFGSPDDEGHIGKRLAMSLRPPMSDLLPGVQIAGPSEASWPTDYRAPGQDVVTVLDGAVAFMGTGHSFPASFSPDGWWVMDVSGFQRAQTRLSTDAKTAGETWMVADWSGGLPQRVGTSMFVKTAPTAGFGTMRQAARSWQSGATIGTNTPYFTNLYKNGTGERLLKYLDTGLEYHDPITSWGLDGHDLWWQRVRPGDFVQNRRWTPLRDEGTKIRWVMDHSEFVMDSGEVLSAPPWVTYYVDTGKAIPPAAVR
ncbi:hypothetical protein [Ideonella sp.]|uniref:hypothetical protein n=1 Tax=Ideonella sp. TaxID=1929293 RepID=UPI002B492AE5|nr:hypothetical protein [Ideonella sp.]HJV69147.1 hypothetical protein [Ideonella sp.]